LISKRGAKRTKIQTLAANIARVSGAHHFGRFSAMPGWRSRGVLRAKNYCEAGWSWGCVFAVDVTGRTIWIADAHRDNGKRFVVRADEKLKRSRMISDND
jgi:hypothetical protein